MEKRLAAFAGLIGIIIMWCWLFGQNSIFLVFPAMFTVVFNTGLCITIAALAVFLLQNNAKVSFTYKCLASIFLMMMGIIIILQHTNRIPMIVDQLFVKVTLTDVYNHPGRMSPLTATTMFAFGFTLIFFNFLNNRFVSHLVPFLLFGLTLLGAIGLVANALDFNILYDMKKHGKMSPITAFCLLVLTSALWVNWYHSTIAQGMKLELIDVAKFSAIAAIVFVLGTTAVLLMI